MLPSEYNRHLQLAKSALWREVYARHLKPGKKASNACAAVHADTAVAEFTKRFATDLTDKGLPCSLPSDVPGPTPGRQQAQQLHS